MSTAEIVILVLVLLAVAAIAAALLAQNRKRSRLRSTFGPEYDRTVETSGGRRDAERDLAEREERRRSLDIRPLPEEDRSAYADRWRSAQADFVDHPELAVRQADLLVAEVMGRRGYPVGDFEQMSRDVSVDHAGVVHDYRTAHEISELNDRKQASTEQLRQAMVHYRALFTELLDDDQASRRDPAPHDELRHDEVRHDPTARDEVRHDGSHEDGTTTGDPGSSSDEDRRSAPVDTSRADGVRVEPGGLGRGRGDTGPDHDLPRDARPRT